MDAVQLSGKFFANLRSHKDKRLHARRGLQILSFTEFSNAVLNAKSLFTAKMKFEGLQILQM